jgi:hypothetical protein
MLTGCRLPDDFNDRIGWWNRGTRRWNVGNMWRGKKLFHLQSRMPPEFWAIYHRALKSRGKHVYTYYNGAIKTAGGWNSKNRSAQSFGYSSPAEMPMNIDEKKKYFETANKSRHRKGKFTAYTAEFLPYAPLQSTVAEIAEQSTRKAIRKQKKAERKEEKLRLLALG